MDSSVSLRAMADALREHFSQNGPTPLYVVIGRGGPNLVRGMSVMTVTATAHRRDASSTRKRKQIATAIRIATA